MWIPGSLLCVPAFFIVLRMWNLRESRLDKWRQRGVRPATLSTRRGNFGLALRLGVIALATFAVTLGVGLISTGQRF